MKISGVAALAAAAALLSGCATVVEGSHETVAVMTVPASGADCTLSNHEGQWHVTAPGKTEVARSSSALRIDCTAPGYGDGHALADSHFNAATFGNVVAGGLIGVGIDAATGANYSYADRIAVPLGAPEMSEAPTALPAQPTDWREPPAAAEPQTAPAPVAAIPAPPPQRTAMHDTPATSWQPVPQADTATPTDDAPAPPSDEPPPWGAPPG